MRSFGEFVFVAWTSSPCCLPDDLNSFVGVNTARAGSPCYDESGLRRDCEPAARIQKSRSCPLDDRGGRNCEGSSGSYFRSRPYRFEKTLKA